MLICRVLPLSLRNKPRTSRHRDRSQRSYILMRSLQKSLNKIAVYFLFLLILVTCLGTLMFMVENGQPDTQFTDLATSVYWAIVTMTTVGYGDITPVTPIGRLLSAFVMLLGYTIIAVPTGIVTANIIDETKEKPKAMKKKV